MGAGVRAVIAGWIALAGATGCSKNPDGAGWANKQFGAGEADALLDEYRTRTRQVLPPEGAEQELVARRPFVVLEDVTGVDGEPFTDVRYHAINAKLHDDEVAATADDVESFVVVRRDIDEEMLGYIRIRRRNIPNVKYTDIQALLIVDRETSAEYHDVVMGHDDASLLEALVELPSDGR